MLKKTIKAIQATDLEGKKGPKYRVGSIPPGYIRVVGSIKYIRHDYKLGVGRVVHVLDEDERLMAIISNCDLEIEFEQGEKIWLVSL